MFVTTCPRCSREIPVPEKLIGQVIACGNCTSRFTANLPKSPEGQRLGSPSQTLSTPTLPAQAEPKLTATVADSEKPPPSQKKDSTGNAEFGAGLRMYSDVSHLVGVLTIIAALIAAFVFMGNKQYLLAAACIIGGAFSALTSFVTSEVCIAIIHVVKNSFRACEILERLESKSKQD